MVKIVSLFGFLDNDRLITSTRLAITPANKKQSAIGSTTPSPIPKDIRQNVNQFC
jgi:hypothetical protein